MPPIDPISKILTLEPNRNETDRSGTLLISTTAFNGFYEKVEKEGLTAEVRFPVEKA